MFKSLRDMVSGVFSLEWDPGTADAQSGPPPPSPPSRSSLAPPTERVEGIVVRPSISYRQPGANDLSATPAAARLSFSEVWIHYGKRRGLTSWKFRTWSDTGYVKLRYFDLLNCCYMALPVTSRPHYALHSVCLSVRPFHEHLYLRNRKSPN